MLFFLVIFMNKIKIIFGSVLMVSMVKEMNCKIVVCEFEPQSLYYDHFRTNNFGKGMNPLILPALG